MSTPSAEFTASAPFPRPLALALMCGLATLFAANHVSARVAFDAGAGLLLAIVLRSGVAALAAATAFAGALWITEHRLAAVGSTLRSLLTMLTVLVAMVIAGGLGLVPGGMAPPQSLPGWAGLVLLALFYALAFSTLFITVPRLDMARNAPAMNMEPVAALVLGYLVLGQALSPVQLVGGAIVLAGILFLGLSKRA